MLGTSVRGFLISKRCLSFLGRPGGASAGTDLRWEENEAAVCRDATVSLL